MAATLTAVPSPIVIAPRCRDIRRSRWPPGEIVIAGGSRLTVRSPVPLDRAGLRAFYEGLSEHSRFLRFLQPMPRITEAVLDLLVRPDHLGVVALDGTEIVADAMLVPDRDDPASAEIAYAVADRLHRRGLGRAIVGRLLDQAAAIGVCRVHAVMSGENRASAGLMRSMGARMRFDDGLLVAEMPVCDEQAAA